MSCGQSGEEECDESGGGSHRASEGCAEDKPGAGWRAQQRSLVNDRENTGRLPFPAMAAAADLPVRPCDLPVASLVGR